MKHIKGFSIFEILLSLLLVTSTLLFTLRQQWYIHRIVLQLLDDNYLLAQADILFDAKRV